MINLAEMSIEIQDRLEAIHGFDDFVDYFEGDELIVTSVFKNIETLIINKNGEVSITTLNRRKGLDISCLDVDILEGETVTLYDRQERKTGETVSSVADALTIIQQYGELKWGQ